MDALSGVASGMAVISLSLQLIQSIDIIRTKIRHVKGAPGEVERLALILDSLGALLDDVRQMMESQSSSGEETIPMPSMTIFDCLKGCEREIVPLSQMVQDYEQREKESGSKIARLRMDAKIGFKTKGIASIEERIQQEIKRLHMALTINNTRQLHALRIFVGKQTSISTEIKNVITNVRMSKLPERVPSSIPATDSTPRTERASVRLLSSRRPFGVHRQEMIHTKLQRCLPTDRPIPAEQEQSYEEVFFWACQLLGIGIRWSRRRIYGTVLSSISTYPVVPEFSRAVYDIIAHGDVSDLEQAFHGGEVHPFARDQHGESLYHMAALNNRSDICQLLGQLGVKAEASFSGIYPLEWSLRFFARHGTSIVSIIQFFILEPYFVDYLTIFVAQYFLELPVEALVWVWRNREDIFCGEDTSALAHLCVRSLLYWLNRPESRLLATEYLKGEFAPLLQDWVTKDSFQIHSIFPVSPTYWIWYMAAAHSYEVGEAFLDIIAGLGIDIAERFNKELEKYPNDVLVPNAPWLNKSEPDRRLDFVYTRGVGWRLGWEWMYDDEAPGYLLVSEFSSLAADMYWTIGYETFPFSEVDLGEEWEEKRWQKSRFDRRCAAKTRKELARMGLKQPRSKMPGRWIE